ncbi:3-oxoacyl-[acyl-carrier-protein] reductase FabG-like [Penaeus monodon]|uniref:3-oxoacyl-[acyl-carrier-protein] reductase FabG-like n=1 Tax=Penaeus monodon TaxID=6687 RepID=UPI0018A6F1F4|nr:3-oxoacyl-[acyl-carrier-protein] reductase FabG-like [Penaeus monodon]
MVSSLKGKVALITGATSGIGKACAIALAAEGCFVSVTGRNTEALKEVTKLCYDAGLPEGKVFAVDGDVAKDDDCKKIVDSTVAHFKKLDILINNAGILVLGGIESISMEDYDKQMDVNVKSVFVLTKLALPHIIETKGNIINVSSVCGIRSIPGMVAYNMSKAAVDQFTRSVALEVAARGVRVNSVNPGLIITDIHRRAGMSEENYEKMVENTKKMYPLGRAGEVEDVTKAVIYLASEDSSFVTGVTLPIDGGRILQCPR